MVRCANCGCQNIEGAKECTNCKCILLKGGISFQPATFTRTQKFWIKLCGIMFLCGGLFFSYDFIKELISGLNDTDIISLILYLVFGLFELFPAIICFGGAWLIFFCVKHGQDADDISNINNNGM